MDARVAYAGCALDRAAHLRTQEGWLRERLSDPASRLLPVWRDRNLLVEGVPPRSAPLDEATSGALLQLADEAVFLGVGEDGRACFACDLSRHGENEVMGLVNGAQFQDLSRVVTVLARDDGALLGYARSMASWHRRHRFCGACGSPTEARNGGHLRVCLNPECRAQHFPRTDPVVIMLLTRNDGAGAAAECLLARQRQWVPGLMSALAGFVEPGETLEEAVRREVREETALAVTSISYRGSQPWPFPASLMLGFVATVADGIELAVDREELEDARWFRRDEVADIRGLGLRLPFRGTIARALIESWLAEGEAGTT